MALPTGPVTLSLEQVAELNRKLSDLRHGVNNHLSLLVAAVELIRRDPTALERMNHVLSEQPQKISNALRDFSSDLESALGLRGKTG